jgi:hypothetical protein
MDGRQMSTFDAPQPVVLPATTFQIRLVWMDHVQVAAELATKDAQIALLREALAKCQQRAWCMGEKWLEVDTALAATEAKK